MARGGRHRRKARSRTPRKPRLRTRYASALLNTGSRANSSRRAGPRGSRVAARSTDRARCISCRRRSAASATCLPLKRRRAKSSRRTARASGATTRWPKRWKRQHQYQAVVDALAPAIAANRGKGDASFDTSILLPHLGFAYQEIGQHDKAIASFEEARKLSPDDPAVAGYLVESNIAAKRYAAAIDVAKSALAAAPRRFAVDPAPGAGAPPERQGRSGHRAAGGGGQAPRGRPRCVYLARAGVLRRGPRRSSGEGAASTPRPSSRPMMESRSSWDRRSTSRRSFRKRSRRSARFLRAIRRTPSRSTIWATCSPSGANVSTNRWAI